MNGIFGAEISLGDALLVTAICMAIVFFVLLVIAGILNLFKYIPAEPKVEKKTAPAPAKAPVAAAPTTFDPNSVTDERMVVAMLVASMEAAAENDGAYIKVRNIREIYS